MQDPQESSILYDAASTQQQSPGSDQTPATSYQTVSGQEQTAPPMPPIQPRSSGGRFRTGAILILALVLVLVLEVGLFAGWQFGRSSTTQPAVTLVPVATIAPLGGNNLETVYTTVIVKAAPAVVQVDVTTQSGGAIGSGNIIDKRGYIVTNNHVVEGAQSIRVTLYDGSKLPAQLTGTDPGWRNHS